MQFKIDEKIEVSMNIKFNVFCTGYFKKQHKLEPHSITEVAVEGAGIRAGFLYARKIKPMVFIRIAGEPYHI